MSPFYDVPIYEVPVYNINILCRKNWSRYMNFLKGNFRFSTFGGHTFFKSLVTIFNAKYYVQLSQNYRTIPCKGVTK